MKPLKITMSAFGSYAGEVTVDFDDSIIEDTNTTIDRNIKLVEGGLRSKLSAIMEINKCTEPEARKELKRIAEENQITGRDIDWIGGDEEDEQEQTSGDDEEEAEDNQKKETNDSKMDQKASFPDKA